MVAVTSQIDANCEVFAANRASMMTFIERLRSLEARASEASEQPLVHATVQALEQVSEQVLEQLTLDERVVNVELDDDEVAARHRRLDLAPRVRLGYGSEVPFLERVEVPEPLREGERRE